LRVARVLRPVATAVRPVSAVAVAPRMVVAAAAPLARRTFVVRAEAASAAAASKKVDASSGYLNFRFTSPTTTFYADKPVYMVQLSAVSGEMAALGGHQPSIVQLKPGVVGVQEEQSGPSKRFFVPGGFCVIKADNTAAVTASEVIPVDDLDINFAKQALTEQTAAAASAPEGSTARVRAQVGTEVYTAMVAAIEAK